MPVLDLFSLAAHNALVTGASRGIGNACALALAQAGAHLCLVLRPAPDEPPCVAALRAQLPATTITVVYADLSDPVQVKAVFPQALALMGTIDVLVHCAGIQRRAPAVDFPESDWDDVSDPHDIIDDVPARIGPRPPPASVRPSECAAIPPLQLAARRGRSAAHSAILGTPRAGNCVRVPPRPSHPRSAHDAARGGTHNAPAQTPR